MAAGAAQAGVQLLTDPSQMTTDVLVDFESGIPTTGPVTFSPAAQIGLAGSWADNVTPSGSNGLTIALESSPLVATFSQPMQAVGFYFGNDDFGLAFDVTMSAYDAHGLVGSVSLPVNRNDRADQFIGLISDTALSYVEISYQRPQAQSLSVYIDDFRATTAVPEPGTMLLAGFGLATLALLKRRRA